MHPGISGHSRPRYYSSQDALRLLIGRRKETQDKADLAASVQTRLGGRQKDGGKFPPTTAQSALALLVGQWQEQLSLERIRKAATCHCFLNPFIFAYSDSCFS